MDIKGMLTIINEFGDGFRLSKGKTLYARDKVKIKRVGEASGEAGEFSAVEFFEMVERFYKERF